MNRAKGIVITFTETVHHDRAVAIAEACRQFAGVASADIIDSDIGADFIVETRTRLELQAMVNEALSKRRNEP